MASSSSLAQALVCAIALPYPNTASVVQIVFLHGLFVGAAVLFRSAGWKRFPRAEDAD